MLFELCFIEHDEIKIIFIQVITSYLIVIELLDTYTPERSHVQSYSEI